MSRPRDPITDRPSDESGPPSRDEFSDRRPKRPRAVEDDEDHPRDIDGGRFRRRGSRREDWPMWVQLGLWGLPNRASAWAFFWVSLTLAVGGVAAVFVHPLFALGGLMVFAALWYYASIRWVDRHDQWE
jgi:hypothetical protein